MNEIEHEDDQSEPENATDDSPTAHPTASATIAEQAPKSAPDPTLQLGTDPPLGRTDTRMARTGKHQRQQILAHLTERDRSILLGLAAHRYLTTTQIQRLYFYSHKSSIAAARAAVRVLARLHSHGLVMRLQRRVGGFDGGSRAYIWAVTDTGEKAIGDLKNVSSKRRRYDQPSTQFLDHVLAITDTRLEIIEGDRNGAFTIVQTQMEPQCWRPYLNRHGQATHLKPDLFIVTQTPDYEDHWMIEVDRGTEHLPTVLRKCHAVQLYHDRGIEQARTEVFPLTVWVVPDAARRLKVEAAITTAATLDNELFRIIELDNLTRLMAGGGTLNGPKPGGHH